MNSVKGNINMNRIRWWRSSSRTCIVNWAHWTQWSEGLTLLATVNFEPDIITLYNMAFNRTLYKNNFSDVIWQLVVFSNMFVHVLIYLHNVCKSMLKRVLLRTWYRQLCCQVLIKRKCKRYLDRHWKLDCIA